MALPRPGTPAFAVWRAGRAPGASIADRTVADWIEGVVTTYRPAGGETWAGLLGRLADGCVELDVGGMPALCCVEILPGRRARVAEMPGPDRLAAD